MTSSGIPNGRRARQIVARAGAVLTLAVALSAVGSSASSGASTRPSGKPYYIAAELSLSGVYSSFETPMYQGLQVAVKDINKSGGVLGHPVALDVQSDDSDTTKVPLALQSIFTTKTTNRIIFMLPNVLAPVVATVLPYTEKYGIPTFEAATSGTLLDPTVHPYNFGTYPSADLQVPAYVTAVTKLMGSASAVKLGILNDTQVTDVALATSLMQSIKQAGGAVADQEQFQPGATDVSVQVGKLQNAGANVVVILSSGHVPVEAAQSVQQLGWTSVKLLAGPAEVNATIQAAIPSAVSSQFYTLGQQAYLQNSQGTGPQASLRTFAKELAATSGGINDLAISANTRDSVVLAAWAVNKAGSTNIHKVLKVLQNLKKKAPPSNLLLVLPNPKWTSTNHSFSNADLSKTFWALLRPGQEVMGTLRGEKLAISK